MSLRCPMSFITVLMSLDSNDSLPVSPTEHLHFPEFVHLADMGYEVVERHQFEPTLKTFCLFCAQITARSRRITQLSSSRLSHDFTSQVDFSPFPLYIVVGICPKELLSQIECSGTSPTAK